MRYYAIVVSNATNGKPIQGADGSSFGPYSSQINGVNNPGALDIIFDIPIFTFDTIAGAGYLKILGIGLPVMGQSSQFNGANIQFYAGMQKGLPLASSQPTPALVLESVIMQAYGTWEGTQQSLDFQIFGAFGNALLPKNIVLKWMPGQDLVAAVTQTLTTAFPGSKITTAVKNPIMLPFEMQPGYFQSVGQFAEWVMATSMAIVGNNYTGLRINRTITGFNIFDGTTMGTPKQINFTDLIGQPTWINFTTINFKTVLRGDIAVGDYIKMPNAIVLNTPQAFSQFRDGPIFQGSFLVTSVRHIGHYKQSSADSWVTVFEAQSMQNQNAVAA